MTRFRVVVTEGARAQIQTIATWWRDNRDAAPDLFTDELTVAFDRLVVMPHIGSRYPVDEPPGVRRLLLRRCQYHVYYTVEDTLVIVRAVWHSGRDAGPAL